MSVIVGCLFLESLSDHVYACPSCKDVYVRLPWPEGDDEYHEICLDNDDVWQVEEHPTEMHWSDLQEEDFCYPCVQSDREHCSTIVRIEAPDGDKHVMRFGDIEAFNPEHGEIDEWFNEIGFTKRNYVHTDGWRGYHDTRFEGLVEVETGWVTGDWSDVPWKKDIHHFMEALEAGEIEPPVDLFMLFEPTSNVFSTACALLARKGEEEPLKEWIASLEYDLERALG
jgi:hypothetical protein